jgi:hypothetical protein
MDALLLHQACQQRILQRCEMLQLLVKTIQESAADDRTGIALDVLSRSFEATLALHRLDHEMDLFPALEESMAGSDALCIREMARGLGEQHRALEAQWWQVRAALADFLEGRRGDLPIAEADALLALCRHLVAFEDQELLPMARRLLDEPALQRLKQAMRERRGHARAPAQPGALAAR